MMKVAATTFVALMAVQAVAAQSFTNLTQLPTAVAGAWVGGNNDCTITISAGQLDLALALQCGPGAEFPIGFESFKNTTVAGKVTTASCSQDVQRGMANGVLGLKFTEVLGNATKVVNGSLVPLTVSSNVCIYYQRFQAKQGVPAKLRVQLARAPVAQQSADAVSCYAQIPTAHLEVGITQCVAEGIVVPGAANGTIPTVIADTHNCVNSLQASCDNSIQDTITAVNVGMAVGGIGLIIATGIAVVFVAKHNKVEL